MKNIIKRTKIFLKLKSYFFPNRITEIEKILSPIINSKKIKTIVQIGSNNGIDGDPLFSFIRLNNLNAILIEALPSLFNELKENHKNSKNVICLNYFVSKSKEKEIIYYFEGVVENNYPKWILQLGSFDPNHSIELLQKYKGLKRSFMAIQTISIEKIFNKYFIPDLLHIDTEGFDFEIIKMIDFKKYKPKYILYEYVHLNKTDQEFAKKLLLEIGYNLKVIDHDVLAILE